MPMRRLPKPRRSLGIFLNDTQSTSRSSCHLNTHGYLLFIPPVTVATMADALLLANQETMSAGWFSTRCDCLSGRTPFFRCRVDNAVKPCDSPSALPPHIPRGNGGHHDELGTRANLRLPPLTGKEDDLEPKSCCQTSWHLPVYTVDHRVRKGEEVVGKKLSTACQDDPYRKKVPTATGQTRGGAPRGRSFFR
ncbi:hypothetical protein MRX96_057695 [Rhipicephalus microplus]